MCAMAITPVFACQAVQRSHSKTIPIRSKLTLCPSFYRAEVIQNARPWERVLVFLEVKAALPVNNAKEFLAYLKANPGRTSFGTPGNDRKWQKMQKSLQL
jgi:hypothetical protein